MHRLIQTLRDDITLRTERGGLVRSAMATAAMKAGATGIAFVSSLLYARVLGPHDFGLYAYVLACTTVLTIPASLGITQYLVREGAREPNEASAWKRWADRRLIATGALAGLLLACASLIPQAAGAGLLFILAAPIPLLANLSGVRQAILQAHGRIVRSQWPQLLFAPAGTVIFLAALWAWHGRFRPSDVIVATVIAAALQLGINSVQLGSLLPTNSIEKRTFSASVKPALPFMWIGALYLVMSRIDLILLGSLKGAHEAGIYAIAARAAEFVPFFLIAINTTIAPKISHLYRDGDVATLQRLTTASARRMTWATLPFALVLILLAHPLLAFFYGNRYVEGATALQILVLAQFFTVASGPVGILLNMTEHAGISAKAFGAGAVLNVMLNLVLIPPLGIIGAATATAISIAFSNVLRWRSVRLHLGIRPSAFLW
jgi:O-antigen/teichoic acid export membrane protein